jgi:BlaI family transcriptional regulator, penicillinase repressor
MRRSDRMAGIGELQLRVLDVLGQLGEGTVYDVLEAFGKRERPRYTTVLTVLRTLEEKGLAAHSLRGRSHVFRPTEQAGRVRGRVLGDVLDRAFGGSPQALVAALLDVDAVTPEVLGELRALIAAKEGNANGD